MARTSAILRLCACFWFGAAAGGCVSDDEVIIIPARLGSVTVAYTLAGTTDPGRCVALGISFAEFVIFDRYGTYVTVAYAPCQDFEVTAVLPEDTYFGDVTLVDTTSRARTLPLALDLFTIIEGRDLFIDADFPAGSVL